MTSSGPAAARRPVLSVLVCTYQRAPLLRGLLESLCAQSLDRDAFEVVVVDDGSTDGTASLVERFATRLDVRYAYQRNSGLASARNHALFLARGEIVVLQDDDDLASERLLEEHVRAHEAHPDPAVAVLGYTDLLRPIADDPLMRYVTGEGRQLFSYGDLRDGQMLDFSYFWGGRSSCKRRFLLENGVFDPVFRFGCEDIELAFRLRQRGFRIVYQRRALTSVVRPFDFDGFCARLVRQGRSNWVFSRLHPDPLVQAWTGVEQALGTWESIAPVYDATLRAARRLDRAVRTKRTLGMVTVHDRADLHAAYEAAFRAARIRGIAERAREGEPPPR